MPFELIMIVLGAFAAAFAVGAAGFGDALVATAFWLPIFTPQEAVPLIVALGLTIQIVTLWRLRRQLDYRRMVPFIVGGALGIPLGSHLLGYADPDVFRLSMGVFLLVYGGFLLSLKAMPAIAAGGRLLDGGVGGVGGVLGGLAGLSGFIPALWCTQRGWPPEQQRGVTQPYILTMHGMALGWLAVGGFVTAKTGDHYLWTLPGIVAGCWLGLKFYGRMDARKFRKIVLIMLMISGSLLLAQTGGKFL